MRRAHDFVLEAIDPETDCIARDTTFEVEDVSELKIQLQLNEFDPQQIYEVDQSDIDRLRARFNVDFQMEGLVARIRPSRWFDTLPYKIHTNRELVMMLAGTKPLAAFEDIEPSNSEYETIPERLFEPHVMSGRFVKKECVCALPGGGTAGQTLKLRRVLYALADQQWRIDAYLLLLKVAEKSGWNEGFERMQGSLLGYEEWQNDIYIKMAKANKEGDNNRTVDATHQ